MIPVGVGIVFLAYTTGIWVFCLVRGYNVKFTQLFSATWPGSTTAKPGTVTSTSAPPPPRAGAGPAPRG